MDHVKVADFGLLKDLGEVDCSLVGGLTPIYAPPEVFDGRPSMYSDQYSLAVMYQELLTNTRPFSGRTIAQLATQHVHNAPNLNPLPACDRPCVARALEKTPERRFESCTAFVERLLDPRSGTSVAVKAPSQTEERKVGPVEDLPSLDQCDVHDQSTKQTHALVVALGGTGADCLANLRARLEPLGAGSAFKLHSVLFDTDAAATHAAMVAETTDNASKCRVVHTEIQSAQQYRRRGTDRLKSISRRWIYNIPRNQLTGGMRPLGRLALVDHGQEVLETLREAVEELKSSIGSGARARVYVTGSLTGGTGSGMYIDVVYLLRHLLDSYELENLSILSFLTTNRFQGDPSRPLSLHATRAGLSEIAYFLKPDSSYPGDPGAGWPSVPAARTPLRDAYVVAPADIPGAPSPVESVVNYIWNASTACGKWLDQGRESQTDSVALPSIRTMNAIRIGDPQGRQTNLIAQSIVNELLLRWLGNPKDSKENALDLSKRIVRRCYLDQQSMHNVTLQWIGHTQSDRRTELMEQLKTLDPTDLKNDNRVRTQLANWLTRTFNEDRIDVAADQIVSQLQREITLRMQDQRASFSVVLAGIADLRSHASKLERQLLDAASNELTKLEIAARNTSKQYHEESQGPLSRLRHACDVGEQLLSVFAYRLAASVASKFEGRLDDLTELYSDSSARIAHAIKTNTDDLPKTNDPLSVYADLPGDPLLPIIVELHDLAAPIHLPHLIVSPSTIDTDTFLRDLTGIAIKPVTQFLDGSMAESKSTTHVGTTDAAIG